MRILASNLLLIVVVGTAGCGGNESHLPPPRMAAEEDEGEPGQAALNPNPPTEVTAPPPQPASAPAAVPAPPAPTPSKATPEAAESESRRQVVDRLTQIGRGLESYRERQGYYPSASLGDFSWRVFLLVDLGRQDLWGEFDTGQPLGSPRNTAPSANMPQVFASGAKQTHETCLIVMTGPGTAYPTPGRRLLPDCCPDGFDNTILVFETGPEYAVPWAGVGDYVLNRETVHQAMFGRRKDCCYALFGGKTGVRRIPATISDEHLLALITPDGGELVSALDVTRPPTPEPDEELLKYLQEHPIVRFAKREEPPLAAKGASANTGETPRETVSTTTPSSAPSRVGQPKLAGGEPVPNSATAEGRLPIPDEISQQLARRVLREAHREDYTKAKTDDEKKELADKLLARARSPDIDPAGRYVALELSRKIAVEIGDIPKALESLELTTQGFQTEGRAEKAEILVSSIGLPLSESDNELVLSEGRKLMEQVLERNEFDLADQFLNVAVSAARRTRDAKLIAALTARKKEIADARAGWAEVADYVDLLLQHPTHPEANEIVGTYYCLVKQRWEDGLPLLARAADPRLTELAETELRLPATPAEQVSLADRWWNLAEGDTKHKMAVRARSAYWYRQALSGLPPGLERIKAESRLAKAESKDRTERQVETP